ncbi:Transmembrane secretion effector [Solimonas aquatica]|uniref:Multidrug efflux pump Tap n=1 Tax=Solimonas aquatica TaxID=489703 RepID=A0A1H9JW54_9GAMM|nr:MFS transporter [Solimonas aquatica]SEQ91156.1 Transmembrane secretion effector [Solimonas aquatica]
MPESLTPARHDPYAALRYPEFRALAGAAFLLNSGIQIQGVALSYELYKLTHDPLALGLIGLAEALPFITLALFGGHLADRREKRGIIRAALLLILAGSVFLTYLASAAGRASLPQAWWLLCAYGVISLLGLARGFLSPATQSLRALLVPREIYGNSATWWSTVFQTASIGAPVTAGFLYAAVGLSGVLYVVLGMFALSFALTGGIAPRAVAPRADQGSLWQSLGEGLRYVFRTRMILYAISLDMFSVLFGGVMAILPVYASDILQVGPEGLGLLRAAPAIGALLTVLICAWLPPLGKPWRNLLLSVLGFGLATYLFAVSKLLWLSLLALFLTGAFDSVSVIIRNTLMQAVPPEHIRGRVMSVNAIFISSSNELGAFESGLAARLMGTVPSVLAGATVTLGVVAWMWRRSKELFAVRF